MNCNRALALFTSDDDKEFKRCFFSNVATLNVYINHI